MKKQNAECCGCTYRTTVHKYTCAAGVIDPVDYWLCELCAGTPLGNKVESRIANPMGRAWSENWQLLATICYVGNAIITAVTGLRNRNR